MPPHAPPPAGRTAPALTPEVRFSSPGFLLNKVGAVAAAWITEAFVPLGIGPRHGRVLLTLRSSGAMGQGPLARELGYDASTLVLLLNDLEDGELITRRRDTADRRRHIVEITEAGLLRRAEADAAVTEVEERLLGDLAPEERTALRALLLRIDERTAPDWVEG